MEQLQRAIDQLGITVTPKAAGQFHAYMEQTLAWNEKVNLTAITDRGEFVKKHYIDSIACANYKEVLGADKIVDVGTGAGFPGVPLAIVFPEKQFLLIDSLDKRVKIIRELCESIGIRNVEAIHGRAEDLAHDREYRQRFGLCVSRAVAKLPVLAEYCLPFVKEGGFFIPYKGPDTEEELAQAKKALKTLGGSLVEERRTDTTAFGMDHSFIIIEKTAATPTNYPRKAGIPSKKPLI